MSQASDAQAKEEPEEGKTKGAEKDLGDKEVSKVTKEDVIHFIENMSVLELSDLVKELEERFGVSAQAAMAVPAQAGETVSEAPGAKEEEKTEFNVMLKATGDKKIQVIKVIRNITGLGLKESKEVVDNVPNVVKEGVSKEEAEDIKNQLEEAGAQVEVE